LGFAVVIEPPAIVQVGDTVRYDGKSILVSNIDKVEFVNNTAVLIGGRGTILTNIREGQL
jgi:hypothetical protein